MITYIEDVDNLSLEELESLQRILKVLSPGGVWNSKALDNAINLENRIVAAERRIKVEEGIIHYMELLRENMKNFPTNNEIIFACVKKCWYSGLNIEDELS